MRTSTTGSGQVSSRQVKMTSRQHRTERRVNHPRRREPIGALPAIADQLQQPKSDHQHGDSQIVDLRRRAWDADSHGSSRNVYTIRMARIADRHVDIEIPTPRPVVGDPAAQRRTQHRRHHQAHRPGRHRQLLLFRRKGFHHDGLRRRQHRGAGEALEQPEDNHLVQRLSRAATRRRHHEGVTENRK